MEKKGALRTHFTCDSFPLGGVLQDLLVFHYILEGRAICRKQFQQRM